MGADGATIIQPKVRRSFAAWLRLVLRLVAAAAAFGAQGIHLSVLPDQAQLWWGYELFSLLVSMVQGILGVSLLFGDPGRWIIRLGFLFNFIVVFVWALTRVSGNPAWNLFILLPVGGADLAATILELALVVILFVLGGTPRRSLPGQTPTVARRNGLPRASPTP